MSTTESLSIEEKVTQLFVVLAVEPALFLVEELAEKFPSAACYTAPGLETRYSTNTKNSISLPRYPSSRIHAASMGGIWECVIYGFGGLRILDDRLVLRPHLPDAWNRLDYVIHWRGQRLRIIIDPSKISVCNLTGVSPVAIDINGAPCEVLTSLVVDNPN